MQGRGGQSTPGRATAQVHGLFRLSLLMRLTRTDALCSQAANPATDLLQEPKPSKWVRGRSVTRRRSRALIQTRHSQCSDYPLRRLTESRGHKASRSTTIDLPASPESLAKKHETFESERSHLCGAFCFTKTSGRQRENRFRIKRAATRWFVVSPTFKPWRAFRKRFPSIEGSRRSVAPSRR